MEWSCEGKLHAGANKGPSAVLLLEKIPASRLDKPKQLIRSLMRQVAPFKAYTFFPGPTAAAAAEYKQLNTAKQVMCLSEMQ